MPPGEPSSRPTPALLDLDDPACADPRLAGAKASWLSRGRTARLPVLAGVVVPAPASQRHMALGADGLARRGSGGARLEVSAAALPDDLARAVVDAAQALGERVVVRSSSVVEGDSAWAGAFTSYLDLGPEDVPRAVVGCWASAFGVSTLERYAAQGIQPGGAPMAVLVQPSLRPDYGGVARIEGEDVVVVAGEGSPAALVQGWEPGVRARVHSDGTTDDSGAVALMGHERITAVAAAIKASHERVGATACEWAVTDGTVHLLQLSAPSPPPSPPLGVPVEPLRSEGAARLARLAARYPGPLGEAFVLPWAVGGGGIDTAVGGGIDTAVGGGIDVIVDDALAALPTLVADLTAQVWGLPPDEALATARTTLRQARGRDPEGALSRLPDLNPPDPETAVHVFASLRAIRGRLVEIGAVTWPEVAWFLEPDEIHELLTHPSAVRKRDRFGFDRWEPFLAAVAMGTGVRGTATTAAPGVAAGRMYRIVDGDTSGFRPRDVVVAPLPVPDLAPLLWDAAALVTVGGGPAAHLFESAQALAIPAVCGIDRQTADELFAGDCLVAVDGDGGAVYSMEW